MGNVCQKSETATPDSKNPVDKIFGRLQLCPHSLNRNDNIRAGKQTNIYQVPTWPPNEQVPTVTPRRGSIAKLNARSTPLNAEWTEVPLKTPEIIQQTVASLQQSSNPEVAPIPPPRKRRRGIKQILDRMNSEDNLKPVEEAIIVPKKEITHICDPTRHPHHYHKTNDGPRKAFSTIIPPVYGELDVKKEITKNMRRGSIPRNSSLPGENNLSLSQATAQRLESYMTRCRSFGSLLPQQIIDKIKNTPSSSAANGQSDAESEDSWGGLDDWDLGVIEHDGIDDGAHFQPISRLPSKKRSSTDVKFLVGNDKNQLPLSISKNNGTSIATTTSPAQLNGRKSGVNLQSILNPIVDISEPVENRVSENEDSTNSKQAPLARRESIEDIEDWFDKDSDNELTKNSFSSDNEKKTDYNKFSSNILYDGVTNPFRLYYEDSTFSSDAFFTSKFLENEKKANTVNEPEASQISDSMDQNAMGFVIVNDTEGKKTSNTDKDNNKQQPQVSEIDTETKHPTILEELTEPSGKSIEDTIPSDNSNIDNPSNKDDNIGHSGLLKFFKTDSNTIDDPDRPDRNNAKVDISGFH